MVQLRKNFETIVGINIELIFLTQPSVSSLHETKCKNERMRSAID